MRTPDQAGALGLPDDTEVAPNNSQMQANTYIDEFKPMKKPRSSPNAFCLHKFEIQDI